MSAEIRISAGDRGVTRLCHFTSSRNCLHILEAGRISSTARLQAQPQPSFNPTDDQRLDGHPDKICCSLEYPNAWYLQRAESRERVFPDWVVLFLQPDYLWREGTLFCPRNAAAEYGGLLSPGIGGFNSLFAPRIAGAQGRVRSRGTRHLTCSPTDDQAEILVPGDILKSDIIAIGVRSELQAQTEMARWRFLELDVPMPILVTPTLFAASTLSTAIRQGSRPVEAIYQG